MITVNGLPISVHNRMHANLQRKIQLGHDLSVADIRRLTPMIQRRAAKAGREVTLKQVAIAIFTDLVEQWPEVAEEGSSFKHLYRPDESYYLVEKHLDYSGPVIRSKFGYSLDVDE